MCPDLPGRGGGRGRRWSWSLSAPPWSRTEPPCSRQGAASGCTLAPLLTVSGIFSSTNDPLYIYLYSCSPAHSIRDIIWVRMIPCTFAPLFVLLLPCSQYPGYYLGQVITCTVAPLLTVSGILSGTNDPLYVCTLICTLAPLLTASGIWSGTDDPLYVCSLICTVAPLLTVSGIFSGYGWSLVRLLPYLYCCSRAHSIRDIFWVRMIPWTFTPFFVSI